MKTAIVTGAAQGVGLVTARLLGQKGHHVVMTDVQPLAAQAAALSSEGLSVSHLSGMFPRKALSRISQRRSRRTMAVQIF